MSNYQLWTLMSAILYPHSPLMFSFCVVMALVSAYIDHIKP